MLKSLYYILLLLYQFYISPYCLTQVAGISWMASCNTQPQVSKTFLTILAVLNKQAFYMNRSSSPFVIFWSLFQKPCQLHLNLQWFLEFLPLFCIVRILVSFFNSWYSFTFSCCISYVLFSCLFVNNYDARFVALQFMAGLSYLWVIMGPLAGEVL